MGLITWVIGKMVYPVIFTGSATYCAFRLGSQLPIASRNAGHWVGMQYNYMKVTLRFFSPDKDQTNQIIKQYRQGSQQAHAFTREVKQSVMSQKAELEKLVPEIGTDPLAEFNQMLSVDDPLSQKKKGEEKVQKSAQNGSVDLLEMHKSRRTYISEKLEKRKSEEHYLKY